MTHTDHLAPQLGLGVSEEPALRRATAAAASTPAIDMTTDHGTAAIRMGQRA